MEHILSVGRIPFLVCAPFFHRFLGMADENLMPNIRFFNGAPRTQNRRLREKEIHLSPSSSIEYAKNSANYVLCRRFCTASTLEIRSVKLFSKYKWENLGGKNVRLSEESDTSVELVKVLSSQRYKVSPVWINSGDNVAAQLLIGDSALIENEKNAWEYSYDLASVWTNWQNLPFVFGAWIIRKEALSGGLAGILNKYMYETELSIADFKADRSACLQTWSEHFPNKVSRSTALDYYNAVDYSFTELHEKSMRKFYELCGMNAELKFL